MPRGTGRGGSRISKACPECGQHRHGNLSVTCTKSKYYDPTATSIARTTSPNAGETLRGKIPVIMDDLTKELLTGKEIFAILEGAGLERWLHNKLQEWGVKFEKSLDKATSE